jgi:aldose 1-epimerase
MFDKGKNGFPGLFISCVTHTVTPHKWHIEYGVTPLLMPGGPINMAQQVFFNLDGLRRTTDGTIGSIADHILHLPMSGMRFDFDDRGISTGNILSNRKGEEHDFWSSPKNIKDALSRSPEAPASLYNETFMIAHRYADYSRRAQPAAILSSELSGISMEVYTDQDAIRVRTWGDELNGESRFLFRILAFLLATDVTAGHLNLKQNQGEGRVPLHGAVSLEQTEWPDAVNHPEWMNKKSLWGNLDIYTGHMAYEFKVDRKQEAARDSIH